MPYIRIAHHSFRKADTLTGCFDQRVRIFLEQLLVVRHLSKSNRVTFALGAITKAVENDQCQWASVFQSLLSQKSFRSGLLPARSGVSPTLNKCTHLSWLPVIRTLLHVRVEAFHPALRPMQLAKAEAFVQSVCIFCPV